MNMSLSEDEVKQIGSYFSRHYQEGERVKVPDNFSDDPLGWLRKQPMFKMYDFPLDLGRYSPDKNKPRILLRERDSFTDFIESLKQREGGIELTSLDIEKFSKPDLSDGHFEWKTWLQHMVEQIANGQGSIKLLASKKGGRNSERREVFNKTNHLSNHFFEILKKNLIKHQNKPVKHIEILEKINYHHQKTRAKSIWQTDSQIKSPSGRVIWSKICNALVNSIISLAKFNPPPQKYQDEIKKYDFIEISIAANKFLSELSNAVYKILNDEMVKASKIKNEIDSEVWREIGISDKEVKVFEEMINKGFSFNNVQSIPNAEKMTYHHSLKLSYHFLYFIIWEGLLETKTMDWKDYLKHYSNPNKREEPKRPDKTRSYPHMLVFTDKFKQLIGNCTLEDYNNNHLHPIFRWLTRTPDRYMYCPPMAPAKKDKNWEGGFCDPRGSIISSHYNYEDFMTPRCDPGEKAVESIKLLQTTQWEINLDFLIAIFDFISINNSESILDIKSNEEGIDQIIPKKELKNAIFHPIGKNSENDIIEKNEQRKRTFNHIKRIIEHNANVFWHAWTFDFRGRMYPRSRNLSPQGDDLDKALIRFKQWKSLGERGIFWLHIHVHNLFEGVENDRWHKEVAQKKQKFQDRDEWVHDNLKELRMIARNPLEKRHLRILELNNYRGGGSESFQRLAAIIELDRVWSEYEKTKDWEKIKSGLAIHLDASTNGYQHLATMLRDEDLAKAVNVSETDNPNDLYKLVSEKAKEIFIEGDFSFTTLKNKLKYKKILSDFSDSEKKFLEETLFTRNFAKQPTMRLAYGGQRLENCYDGKNSSGNPRWAKIKKSQEELIEEQKKRNSIPNNIKKKYMQYENLETWRRVPYGKWGWFMSACGTDAKAKEIQSLLREWKWIRCWSKDSLLYKSFTKNKIKLPDSLREWNVEEDLELKNNIVQQERLIFQNHVTQLCDFIYKHAVRDVTQNVNSKLTNQFKKLFKAEKWNDFTKKIEKWMEANKGWNQPEHDSYIQNLDSLDRNMKKGEEITKRISNDVKWNKTDESHRTKIMSTVRSLFKNIPTSPFITGKSEKLQIYRFENVVRWDLPDGFHVKNYYIRYRDEGDSDKGKPTKRGSIYSVIQPKWLRGKQRNKAIYEHLEELLGKEEFKKISKEYKLSESRGRPWFIPTVEQILSEIDANEEKIKFDDFRKVIKVKDHNINQYSEKEIERINQNKVESSITPNFIHSLDSYHMREIIRRMGSNCDVLDFWSVHDSFGSHASEIDKLREIVISSFHELYKESNVNSLGKKISEHWSDMSVEDFNPEKILKSEYMIS